MIQGGIMKDLKDTRVQKIVNEAYSVFNQMYNSRYPDIYFNGDCIEIDENGNESGVNDTYGHYMIVNNKDYYAINIHSSIECLGYNNYKDVESEIGVEIIKFKGNIFADDQQRYCITLQVNPDSGEFIELFDAEAYYENGIFTATYEQLLKIKPEPIESMKFEYLCSGFHHEYED